VCPFALLPRPGDRRLTTGWPSGERVNAWWRGRRPVRSGHPSLNIPPLIPADVLQPAHILLGADPERANDRAGGGRTASATNSGASRAAVRPSASRDRATSARYRKFA